MWSGYHEDITELWLYFCFTFLILPCWSFHFIWYFFLWVILKNVLVITMLVILFYLVCFSICFSCRLEFGFVFTCHTIFFLSLCFGFLFFRSRKVMFKIFSLRHDVLIISQPSTKKVLIKKLSFNNIVMLKKFTYLL